jgi:protein pelota
MKFMMEAAVRLGDQAIIKQKSKFLKAHASSGYKRAIDELLGNADLRSQLADVKAADEASMLYL